MDMYAKDVRARNESANGMRARPAARRSLRLAAALCLALGPAWTAPAAAQGYSDVVSLGAHELGAIRDVRLAVNKSLVVDLPVDVKDVLVSGPSVADAVLKSTRKAFIIGGEVGQTNVFFFDALGDPVLTLNISVEPDFETLQLTLDRLMPDSDVRVEGMNKGVALYGEVADAQEAKRAIDLAAAFISEGGKGEPESVVNMLTIRGGDQVLVKVTIAEVERTTVKQLGINLGGQLSIGNTVLGYNHAPPFNTNKLPTSALGLAADAGCNALTTGIGCSFLDTTVRALEESGMLRTLAEPTLTAISGEAASFLVGGEFPVAVGFEDGKVSVEFKPYGVSLSMTPVVLGEGRISLKVQTEVSELTEDGSIFVAQGVSIPGLNVRRADSTVEVPSGGTIALAGLLQDNVKTVVSGIPGMMKLPILGSLFQSRQYQRGQSELVILVTPFIANPNGREAFSRPDDGLEVAGDAEAILLGRLHKVYGTKAAPAGAYHGHFGFIND